MRLYTHTRIETHTYMLQSLPRIRAHTPNLPWKTVEIISIDHKWEATSTALLHTVCAKCACLLFIIQSKHWAERLRAKFVILIGFSTDFGRAGKVHRNGGHKPCEKGVKCKCENGKAKTHIRTQCHSILDMRKYNSNGIPFFICSMYLLAELFTKS